jgi:hypothetical protein
MLALTDGTGDKYKFFFPEEMGHLVSLFVWAFDLYLMSFEGYVMDWGRGKDQVDQHYYKLFWRYVPHMLA